MKTLITILLLVIGGLSVTLYVQSRSHAQLSAKVTMLEEENAELPSLRAAQAWLIEEANTNHRKFASANFTRQLREAALENCLAGR